MQIEAIEIYDGEPPTPYTAIGSVRGRVGAATAFSKTPTIEDVNLKLREEASRLGANAVINVIYKRGPIPSSWKGLTATGTAVRVESDDRACPFCAETIKAAAIKCKHCGSDLSAA